MTKLPLEDRVRAELKALPVTEKRMFGGICFMLSGNMLVGASPRGLLVRVGKEGNSEALARPFARPMEQAGRRIDGYVHVDEKGTARDSDLKAWVDMAVRHVSSLPAKEAAAKKPKNPRPKVSRP